MAEFLSMGGYAMYVWPSYALTVLVMVALVIESVSDARQQKRMLALLEGADGARKRQPARSTS